MTPAGEVAEKLARVRGWLDESGYGAALFTSQPSVAWVTAGAEDRVVRNEEPGLVWALVTGTGAFLITTNIELPRLAAEEDCTGFELHAVPWYTPGGLAGAADDLAGGLKLAEAPAALRMPLTAAEQDRLAALGRGLRPGPGAEHRHDRARRAGRGGRRPRREVRGHVPRQRRRPRRRHLQHRRLACRSRPGQPTCHLVHVMPALVTILADARRLKGSAS
jgi:hypothetical protein